MLHEHRGLLCKFVGVPSKLVERPSQHLGLPCERVREPCALRGTPCAFGGTLCPFGGTLCPFPRMLYLFPRMLCMFFGHPEADWATPSAFSEHRHAHAALPSRLRGALSRARSGAVRLRWDYFMRGGDAASAR
jgi:hypothetical protein